MKITAIKLDLDNMNISHVEIERGKLSDIYYHIGNGCRTFACPVTYDNHDTLYCDDEALLNPDIKWGVIQKDWRYPIFGNCLIIGNNLNTGDSISAKTKLEDAQQLFQLVSRE